MCIQLGSICKLLRSRNLSAAFALCEPSLKVVKCIRCSWVWQGINLAVGIENSISLFDRSAVCIERYHRLGHDNLVCCSTVVESQMIRVLGPQNYYVIGIGPRVVEERFTAKSFERLWQIWTQGFA